MTEAFKDVSRGESRHGRATRVLAALAAGFFLVLFVGAAHHYATTLERIVADPLVFDLAKMPHETWLAVGRSPDCGDKPCWLAPDAGFAAFQKVDLPAEDLAPRFKGHGPDEFAYYRFRFDLPEALRDSREELAFSPNWVVHGRYEIFVKGVLVASGNGLTEGGDIAYQKVVTALPRFYLQDGKVEIGIRGTLDTGAIGIHHYGKILLGPARILSGLHAQSEHAMGSYYLLFILSKGGVFIVLALFLVLTRSLPGLGSFAAYAFAVALENLAIGNYLEGMLPFAYRVPIYFGLKAFASGALLSYYLRFIGVSRAGRWSFAASAVTFLLSLGFAIDFSWGQKLLAIPAQHLLVNSSLLLVVATGLVLALLALRRGDRPRGTPRHRRLLTLTALSSVYFVTLIWAFYVKTYDGYDVRAIADLFFFYYVAYVSVVEFGLSQVRVGVMQSRERGLRDVFDRFLGREVAAQVVSNVGNGTENAKANASATVAREVTVLFLDVRHSTALLERYGAEPVLAALNRLVGLVHDLAEAHGGAINKLIGDSMLVVWGLSDAAPSDPTAAVRVALAIREALELAKTQAVAGELVFDLAMGLNFGLAAVGRMGSAERQDFTVIGAAVNRAVRLTALAKSEGVDIMIGRSVFAVVENAILAEELADDAYKLIGMFSDEARLLTYSPAWQAQFGWIETPGLVARAGSNIASFEPLRIVS